MPRKPILHLALLLLVALGLRPGPALADPDAMVQPRVVVFELFTRAT